MIFMDGVVEAVNTSGEEFGGDALVTGSSGIGAGPNGPGNAAHHDQHRQSSTATRRSTTT